MRRALAELLALPPESEEARSALAGLYVEGADNQTAMLAGLLKAAMGGDVKAVQEIRNILGESRDTAPERAERRARTRKLEAEAEAAARAVSGEEPEALRTARELLEGVDARGIDGDAAGVPG